MTRHFFVLAAGLVFAFNATAQEQKKKHTHGHHHHREHKAHVHGAASVGIAFDGTSGKIDFKTPAESIIGFERKPKNEKQEKALSEGLAKLESGIGQMISFAENTGCKLTKEKIESEFDDDGHAEIEASFSVVCSASPAGSTVTLNFQKVFPRLKTVEVQALIGDLQKSVKARKNGTILELK